jgi:hypothetical protein
MTPLLYRRSRTEAGSRAATAELERHAFVEAS